MFEAGTRVKALGKLGTVVSVANFKTLYPNDKRKESVVVQVRIDGDKPHVKARNFLGSDVVLAD